MRKTTTYGTVKFTTHGDDTQLALGFAQEIIGMVTPYFTGNEGRGALLEVEVTPIEGEENGIVVARGELGSITGNVCPSNDYVYEFHLHKGPQA